MEGFLVTPGWHAVGMSIFDKNRKQDTIDPFADPVAFLASSGIEAELIEVLAAVPDAA